MRLAPFGGAKESEKKGAGGPVGPPATACGSSGELASQGDLDGIAVLVQHIQPAIRYVA